MNVKATLGGRYVLEEKIGTGGMSLVYRAIDLRCHCDVAVKVLRRELMDNDLEVRRFEHEANSVSQLDHPNITSLLGVGCEDDIMYIVMEYVPGYTLKDYIKQKGHISSEAAIKIAIAILDAVNHAHKNHIIHRDLKPQNILLSYNGAVKVTDFGISINTTSQATKNTSEIIGSVHYISPEQAKGINVCEQSDLYSVAIILYEMVTGRVPFDGDAPAVITMKQIKEAPIPPRRYEPSVSVALEEVILKGMAKDLRDRYQSATDMASDLSKAMQMPSGGFVVTERERNRDNPKSRKGRPKKGRMHAAHAHSRVHAALRTKPFIWLAVLMSIVIMLASVLALTRMHGTVPVPNMVNMTLEDAQSELEAIGLGYTVVESYHDEIPSGVIITQSPDKGTNMESGDRVILTVSKGVDMVMVPLVTGMTRAEAVRTLTEKSIPIKEEKLVVSSLETGTVVRQTPEAGNWISPMDGVTLEISGSSVDIPDVLDMSAEQATTELEACGLKVTARVYYPSSDGNVDNVMNISPAVGTRVLRGSGVTLTLYAAPPDVYTATVDVTFSVDTDEDTATVRAVLIESDGATDEVYSGEYAPTNQMTLTLTLERSTPGARELMIYVADELVFSETVMLE